MEHGKLAGDWIFAHGWAVGAARGLIALRWFSGIALILRRPAASRTAATVSGAHPADQLCTLTCGEVH